MDGTFGRAARSSRRGTAGAAKRTTRGRGARARVSLGLTCRGSPIHWLTLTTSTLLNMGADPLVDLLDPRALPGGGLAGADERDPRAPGYRSLIKDTDGIGVAVRRRRFMHASGAGREKTSGGLREPWLDPACLAPSADRTNVGQIVRDRC
jgi:hypothetical protein